MNTLPTPATDTSSIDLEAWRLLPWLANNTLEGDELDRVVDQLRRSQRCREELVFLSELRHAAEMSGRDELDVPEDRLANLMERIDVHEQHRRRAASERPKRERPTWGRFVMAAMVPLLVATSWWLAARTASEPLDGRATFHTLSSEAEPAAVDLPRLRLIPEVGLAEEDLRQLVLDVGAEIVAGPTPAGVYTLGWAEDLSDGWSLDEIAAGLRADSRVALAEPARGR